MRIERTLAVCNRAYSFELTDEELERAHDEYEAVYGNSPLLDFIKQEVPYRLVNVLGCKPEQITPELVDRFVTELYDDNDVMFNYDAIDEWLSERLKDGGEENDD